MENNNSMEIANVDIKKLIYTVRGKQVMLDSDVAMLYHCETKYVNRVVKRNIERFPEEFCFQLKEYELENLRCQFVTSSLTSNYGGRRYLPYMFTEQGIAMLSALLRTDIAVKVSINIMKAFIEMRKIIILNNYFNERLTKLECNKFHDRFVIIDNKEVFHCGASLKDLGKKCFAINKMEDDNFLINYCKA